MDDTVSGFPVYERVGLLRRKRCQYWLYTRRCGWRWWRHNDEPPGLVGQHLLAHPPDSGETQGEL